MSKRELTEIKIELDLSTDNIVYLTYEQLLEKHAQLQLVFYEEDILIWLANNFFIQCLSRHPREVKEGENYVFQDEDVECPIEDYIRFYDERSIFDFFSFANQRINAIQKLLKEGIEKHKRA